MLQILFVDVFCVNSKLVTLNVIQQIHISSQDASVTVLCYNGDSVRARLSYGASVAVTVIHGDTGLLYYMYK